MTRIYGLIGTQRSGSNYVCSGLRSVKGLGDPREYFNPVHIHEEGKLVQSRQDPLQFSKELVSRTPRGEHFGFKLHYLQFFENFLSRDLHLHEAFPGIQLVFLRRSNVIRQAVSLWKAELTQSWTAEMDASREAHYDFAEIRSRYFDLKIHDLMWQHYLVDNDLPFLNLIYEDIEKNERKFFYGLLAYLGAAGRFSQFESPSLRKQADAKSEAWTNRFREDYKRCPTDQNTASWLSRLRRWNAERLGDDPTIWREY